MKSIDHRTLLKEIHGDYIDNWFESGEDGEKKILDFIKSEVWRDIDTGKWRFMQKTFKREGQALTAATKYFNNCCKGEK